MDKIVLIHNPFTMTDELFVARENDTNPIRYIVSNHLEDLATSLTQWCLAEEIKLIEIKSEIPFAATLRPHIHNSIEVRDI